MGNRLENKVAIVTGANSGFGYAMTKRFINEGAKVVAADLSKDVMRLTEEFGDSVYPVITNVAKEEEVKSLVDAGIQHFGTVNILCNNAGVGDKLLKTHEYSSEEFERTIKINLMGAFYGMKYIIPHFQKIGGGSIINTASIAAYGKTVSTAPYAASKSAVRKLTEQAAYEYASEKIRVNAIAPGTFDTAIFKGIESLKDKLAADMPVGRLGNPDEMANLALFLASDEASFVTGQTYIIDGGQSLA